MRFKRWDISQCSCSIVPTGGYAGRHTGPHVAESPHGTYTVEPWGQGDRFHAVFRPAASGTAITLIDGVSWSKAYKATKEHLQTTATNPPPAEG